MSNGFDVAALGGRLILFDLVSKRQHTFVKSVNLPSTEITFTTIYI